MCDRANILETFYTQQYYCTLIDQLSRKILAPLQPLPLLLLLYVLHQHLLQLLHHALHLLFQPSVSLNSPKLAIRPKDAWRLRRGSEKSPKLKGLSAAGAAAAAAVALVGEGGEQGEKKARA